jgi:UDP-arabinose 4-epimerase
MKRILVTGGAGYIGSHTAKALSKSGYEPIVFDNLSTGHDWAVRWGPLVRGDLCDKPLIERTLREFEIGAVIHFAASAYVGDSVTHPRHYYQNNIANSLNLLDAMLDTGVRHIVFSSSCATYGSPETLPIREDHRQLPLSPYGESKYFIERAMESYARAYGQKYVSLRYFNAAGADPDGEIGEDHAPEIHLIPRAIAAASGGEGLHVFGDDYPTPDGTCLRDYIHVADLADAHVKALDAIADVGRSAAYNLGTGRPHSVRDVIQTVEQVTGRRVPWTLAPRRSGDPAVLYAAPHKAQTELHWKPRFPELESIVRTAWEWHRTHPHGYRMTPTHP